MMVSEGHLLAGTYCLPSLVWIQQHVSYLSLKAQFLLLSHVTLRSLLLFAAELDPTEMIAV